MTVYEITSTETQDIRYPESDPLDLFIVLQFQSKFLLFLLLLISVNAETIRDLQSRVNLVKQTMDHICIGYGRIN